MLEKLQLDKLDYISNTSYLANYQYPDSCIRSSVLYNSVGDKTSKNHAQAATHQRNPAHVFSNIGIWVVFVKVRLSVIGPDITTSIPYGSSKKQDHQ